MKNLLLKGRYSSYSNAQRSNIPIEEKRDIREDASWSYKGVPQSPRLFEQFRDILYESRISATDAIRRQRGEPTHPVTKALLEAEFGYKVFSAVKDAHGKGALAKEVMFNPSAWPNLTRRNLSWLKRKPLQEMSNEELIQKMFAMFHRWKITYRHALEAHFRQSTGKDLLHRINIWRESKASRKSAVVEVIKERIKAAYPKGIPIVSLPIDISAELKDEKNIISFRSAYPFMINEVAAQLDREGLAPMWILQHQRGYRPFINVIEYKELIRVIC